MRHTEGRVDHLTEALAMTLCFTFIPAVGIAVMHRTAWPCAIWLAAALVTLYLAHRRNRYAVRASNVVHLEQHRNRRHGR